MNIPATVTLYWGKSAKKKDESSYRFHLLIYHCLDVVAVAAYWWDHAPALRSAFMTQQDYSAEQARAWVLFFIALHDLGKFDLRFQCKDVNSWLRLNPQAGQVLRPSVDQCKKYWHGEAGLFWFDRDYRPAEDTDNDFWAFLDQEPEPHPYAAWFPWMEAVTGHHGFILRQTQLHSHCDYTVPVEFAPWLAQQDKTARQEWINVLEALFLQPVGLSVNATPPRCSPLLAGFCSVADWLGSWLSEEIGYCDQPPADFNALQDYLNRRQADAERIVERSGLLAAPQPYGGVRALLDKQYQPRQLQVLVDKLPVKPGVTLIEAPTGSGKTETALAYAWKLIDNQLAESIIFALPTQATANAMLTRLETLAPHLFRQSNVVLAHGNAGFNDSFRAIRQRSESAQGAEDALAQCCEWLAQSRKRAFLGQIGICTIDQVLMAVLPIRHRFIRGFGLGRSVLIVDEIHAYDTYMSGLLNAVLQAQFAAGGSAILLSATLTAQQRQHVLQNYCSAPPDPVRGLAPDAFAAADTPASEAVDEIAAEITKPAAEPYPLISWRHETASARFCLQDQPEHLPPTVSVYLESLSLPAMQPDEALLDRLLHAACSGAQVCLICNLVDVAQAAFARLQQKAADDTEIILFHARFTLLDRNAKENKVLSYFGKNGDRSRGRILVSTQVVEQSLDVDFDWLITQLCPADLLFQRLGRLHRHAQNKAGRPSAFATARATVLVPQEAGYGLHAHIYTHTRVMWHTQRHVEALGDDPLCFPAAYREWLEVIYASEPDSAEPDWVSSGMEAFATQEQTKHMCALKMLDWAKTNALKDSDENVRAVTRDGEMSLSLVPYQQTAQGRRLLSGAIFEQLEEDDRAEALALNQVNVPASWRYRLTAEADEDGYIWLAGEEHDGVWQAQNNNVTYCYSIEKGMARTIPDNPR